MRVIVRRSTLCRNCVCSAAMCYALSLHDALPIYPLRTHRPRRRERREERVGRRTCGHSLWRPRHWPVREAGTTRSEEHTSELQSRENLVCRLLLEKNIKHTG